MNTFDSSVERLFHLSLNQLCNSMDEDTLQYVLKWLPPSICLQIIWKVLRVNDQHRVRYPVIERHESNHNLMDHLEYLLSTNSITQAMLEDIGNSQQIVYDDDFNFFSHFDQKLFFKLVEVTKLRDKLFIVFQICVQIKGFDFPSNFAQEWINTETPDSKEGIYFPVIERGLKLGIFLGDAGWFVESALVLSHTYKLITTKWVCHDRNLELLNTLQCLTKWLLVVSNYNNFEEAKLVLQHLLHTIDIIEQIEERTVCLAYAYLGVSQYYYVLLEFDKAWCWAVKAILEFSTNSGVLIITVLSHAIRVCWTLNKFKTAQQLIDQLYQYQKYIGDINVDLILNYAFNSCNVECKYFTLMDFNLSALINAQELFGYYNLHTATIFANYASIFIDVDSDKSMWCIIQAIFIMQKIGIPKDNMLFMNALQIKSLLLQKIAVTLEKCTTNIFEEGDVERKHPIDVMKKIMFKRAKAVHLNALKLTIQAVGENTLLTAKSYHYLGSFYVYQKKHTQSEKMFLKEIEIKKSILGQDHIEVFKSISHLAYLYTYRLNKLQEAELIFLQTINLYENISDGPYIRLKVDVEVLIEIYYQLNNMERFNHYTDYLKTIVESHIGWFDKLRFDLTNEKCITCNLSYEKFQCILNGCRCQRFNKVEE